MIPESWLEAAVKLTPSAFITGAFVWLHFGRNRRKPIAFSPAKGKRHGLSRDQVRHGIRALESAGLIEVFREPYKAPIVRPLWEHLERPEL